MTNIQYHKGVIDASGCISNGWNLVKPNYWMYFGISLLAMLMIACIPCVNIILLGPVLTGVYYVLLREMRGEPVDFGMMFKGFDKFVPTFVVGLIQSIPGIIYQIFQYTIDIGRIANEGLGGSRGNSDFYQASPSSDIIAGGLDVLGIVALVIFLLVNFIWTITFMFAIPLLAEHDLSPMDAIKLSAKAGWGNAGGLILLFILEFLIGILGVIALCIGIFFVLPVLFAANAFAYRQVFPMVGGPVYRSTPPPPTEYGGSFGRGM